MDSDKDAATGFVEYRVPYGDTDAMGVVYYGNYLLYFERSRNELMRKATITYKEMETRGFGLPVIESHVNYKNPAVYDDLLVISAVLSWVKGVRMRVDCTIKRGDTLIATGYTVHCCMDYKTRRPARVIPEIAELACGDPPAAD